MDFWWLYGKIGGIQPECADICKVYIRSWYRADGSRVAECDLGARGEEMVRFFDAREAF
jgi:hypothetical protein